MQAAYGVRTVRQLRRYGAKEVNKQRPNIKRQQAIENTYEYFLREVDPLIGECITYLLCLRPANVSAAMYKFLIDKKTSEGHVSLPPHTPRQKASKSEKLFLATRISPILTRVVNRVATSRPVNVLDFMCEQLIPLMREEEEALHMSTAPPPPITAHSHNNNMPSTPQSISAPVPPTDKTEESSSPKQIQIVLLGSGGAGKSTFLHTLQGNYTAHTKPSMGFHPVTMQYGSNMKIRFYDLGGGAKIRGIWNQYYHDVHAAIYMIDASTAVTEEDRKTDVALFKEAVNHASLLHKPILVFLNKQDASEVVSEEDLRASYEMHTYNNLTISKVVSVAHATEESQYSPDPRLDEAVEKLLSAVLAQYDVLNARVAEEIKVKERQAAEARLARERKVLKNKIACAFPSLVDRKLHSAELPDAPEDVFTEEEGRTFLAAEIGVEVASLPAAALTVAAMVGYQRLALQLVGALNAPISKKKSPMSWEEIELLICELRRELGLEPAVATQ